MRPRRRAAVTVLALLATLVVPAAVAGSARAATTVPVRDFASDAYGDPWDFSNVEDVDPTPTRAIQGDVANASVHDGLLSFDVRSGQATMKLLQGWGAGSIPYGRDGSKQPIDAATYRNISMSVNGPAGAGGVFWFNCGFAVQSCQGGMQLPLQAGWHTYDLPLANYGPFGLPSGWVGQVQSLWLILPPGHYDFDWVRVYQPGAGPDLRTNPPPRPAILEPDEMGGLDWSTAVRGNPWDMSDASDVAGIGNASYFFDGSVLHGQNAPPQSNDPWVALDVPVPIDGSRFHRLTIDVLYDGPFGLADAPGGGMVGRWTWWVAGSDQPQVSQDIIVYPGWNHISIDMAQPGVLDESMPPGSPGWAGQQITALRFDVNEDPGARAWVIDGVTLRQDDVSRGTASITYSDSAWEPGTTVDVYLDSDRSGFDGIPVATGVPVSGPGPTTVSWNPTPAQLGRWWPYLIVRDPSSATIKYASGPLISTSSANTGWGFDPFGSLDAVSGQNGAVRVSGWAIDPDLTGPIQVHVYVDSTGTNLGNASLNRPDIGAAYPAWGPAHGFDATIPASGGAHNVCAYAINVGLGATRSLGCRTVVVPDTSPFGVLEAANRVPGAIAVSGWAIDPDTTQPIPVHVYVDSTGTALTANGSRPDVGQAFPTYGANHGFSASLPAGPGTHAVCAYGINVGGGSTKLLGCRTVVVDPVPFGSFEGVTRSPGGLTVSGWAIDPDTTNPIAVHVYVDGTGTNLGLTQVARNDVAAAFPGYGAGHGFSGFVPAAVGTHDVCAYAIDDAGGANRLLGCRRVVVSGDPFGNLESVQRTSPSTITVSGWAIDPDTSSPIAVHVYVDAAGTNLGSASLPRSDIAAAFPGYLANHGFSAAVPASPGTHNVCAYAINVSAGTNQLLGCRVAG